MEGLFVRMALEPLPGGVFPNIGGPSFGSSCYRGWKISQSLMPYDIQIHLGFRDVLKHAGSGTRTRPAAMHVVRSV